MPRLPLLLTLVGCLVVLAACSGAATRATSLERGVPAQLNLAAGKGLPALPEADMFSPQRMTANYKLEQLGQDFFSKSADAELDTFKLKLQPEQGKLGYGIYSFPAAPGERISSVSYGVSGRTPNQPVYVAISNYAQQRWEILPPQNSDSHTFDLNDLNGSYASPGGQVFLAVLSYDIAHFSIDGVDLTYAERFNVSGSIVATISGPLQNVTVRCPAANIEAQTDAQGNYTLKGLPNGDWPVVPSLDGVTFFDSPTIAHVQDADVEGVNFTGLFGEGDHQPGAGSEPNNCFADATYFDLENGTLDDSLSAVDDPRDFIRFDVSTAGTWWVEFASPGYTYYPYMTLYDSSGDTVTYSAYIYQGLVRIGFDTVGPRQLVLEVGLSGGAGAYQLYMGQGPSYKIHGTIKVNGSPQDNVLAFVRVQDFPNNYFQDTLYPVGSFVDTGQYTDIYRRPFMTQVYGDAEAYSNSGSMYDLSTGPQLNADAVLTPFPLADNDEPNDAFATAKVFAGLPDPGVAYTLNGTDTVDIYKFTPTSGKGFMPIFKVDYTHGREALHSISFDLYDKDLILVANSGSYVYQQDFTVGRSILLPGTVTTGDPYYLVVSQTFAETVQQEYHLEVQEFNSAPVHLHLQDSAGNGINSAKVDIWSEDGKLHRIAYTNSVGDTPTWSLPQGNTYFYQVFRYGLDIDRTRRSLTVTGSEPQVVKVISKESESRDSHEPDDSAAVLAQTSTLPFTQDGTMSYDDPSDLFVFVPTSNSPIKVTVDFDDDSMTCYCASYDNNLAYLDAVALIPDNTPVVLSTAGTGVPSYFSINVPNNFCNLDYTVSVSYVEGHRISGQVRDLLAVPMADCVVHNLVTGQNYFTDINGNYSSELLEPGIYTMRVEGPELSVSQDDVTVVDADVVKNFDYARINRDQDESNDSTGAAYQLTLPSIDQQYSVGNSDPADFYRFTLNEGDQVYVTLGYELFMPDLQAELIGPDAASLVATGHGQHQGSVLLEYIVPPGGGGDYYLHVFNSGLRQGYFMSVQKI